MNEPRGRWKISYNPEINLGHILSTFSFLAAGITLYVALVTQVGELNAWKTSVEQMNLTDELKASAVREQRVVALEVTLERQLAASQQIIAQLSTLNATMAVLQDRELRRVPPPATP